MGIKYKQSDIIPQTHCDNIVGDINNDKKMNISDVNVLIDCIIQDNSSYNVLNIVSLVQNILNNNPQSSGQIRESLRR